MFNKNEFLCMKKHKIIMHRHVKKAVAAPPLLLLS